MKMMTCVGVVLTGFVGGACAQPAAVAPPAPAEMFSVVQITDMRERPGFEVMSREEYTALLKAIKEEAAVFTFAVTESRKEWDANKENKIPFQGSRVKPRSAKKVSPDFNDREKASKKKAQLEERVSSKQIADAGKDSKKAKPAKSKADGGVSKEDARAAAFNEAYSMISRKMADKLGRSVPSNGF
ncbi:MAG: hypothetical protein WCK89_16665 [bacterium]